jgi:LemA protein
MAISRGLGCVGAIVSALLLIVGVGGCWGVGIYNGLVDSEETVESQWAQVENTYQRRADLIPNLVRTVQGSADFERETLEAVVEARARVGQMNVSPEILENPGAFAQFEQAQDALSSALSRLLVVVERYPEIRSTAAFQDLMVQLEGTENRITVERMRYNEVARDFNAQVRRFPANLLIGLMGWDFDQKAYFEAQEGADEAPEVDFDFGNG